MHGESFQSHIDPNFSVCLPRFFITMRSNCRAIFTAPVSTSSTVV
jgi:hypothetical protein